MNIFIVSIINHYTLFQLISCNELDPPTFRKKILSKSKLYMEERFLPSYKQEKMKLILNEHNKYRDLHTVPRLVLDRNMTYEAETWAELLTSFGSVNINHHVMYGENTWIKETEDIELFMDIDHLNPVREWYNEIVNYSGPYKPPENTKRFTQLVWKSSKRLGCGFAYSALVLYVVCYYDPPGNLVYDRDENRNSVWFYENVLRPKNSTVKWNNGPGPSALWLWLSVIILISALVFLLVFCVYHSFS